MAMQIKSVAVQPGRLLGHGRGKNNAGIQYTQTTRAPIFQSQLREVTCNRPIPEAKNKSSGIRLRASVSRRAKQGIRNKWKVYSIPKSHNLQFLKQNFGKSPAVDRFPKQKIRVRESVSGGRFPEEQGRELGRNRRYTVYQDHIISNSLNRASGNPLESTDSRSEK
jgi:hypothetical protein